MADADAIVVGAGLAGLVAATELTAAGRRVVVVEQESRANLGGQAFWSFGGLFFVDSPEQRRLGVKDSVELAWQDWTGTAGFDRPEDHWPGLWARAYVDFAAGEKRAWLHDQGMRWFPVVGWAERGDGRAGGHGNSVPRFHVTWGTGPGVLEPFVRKAAQAERDGLLTFAFRHRVDELVVDGGAVTGVHGAVLAAATEARGHQTNRDVVGDFTLTAPAVIVTSGGIGGNHDLVRAAWPDRLGTPPDHLTSGVPAYVDGRMIGITEAAGGSVINRDRMWHYVEGIHNWAPIWPGHAIRILPGPSSMWFDGNGRRLPAPLLPRLRHPRHARAPPADRARPLVVRPDAEGHREGVRPLRFGAEPRSDRQVRAPGAQPGPATTWPSGQAGAGLRRPRRRLRHRDDDPGSRGADEHAHPRRAARRRRDRTPGGRARPRAGQRLRQGRAGHRDPRRPPLSRRQAHPYRCAAQVPRPFERPAHRRAIARS